MQKRIIAFIDILGFKQALGEPGQFDSIDELIRKIAEINSIHNFNINTYPDGYGMEGKPEVSSFSDHVVVSICDRAEDDATVFAGYLEFIILTIAKICDLALLSGFLVRGGMSHGDIIHEKNVVFGRALVEAIDIEENIAFYPRILLSNDLSKRIIEGFSLPIRFGTVLQDHDGLFYINWMKSGALSGPIQSSENSDESLRKNVIEKMKVYKNIIEKNLILHKADQRKYRQWHWFAKYYNINPFAEHKIEI